MLKIFLFSETDIFIFQNLYLIFVLNSFFHAVVTIKKGGGNIYKGKPLFKKKLGHLNIDESSIKSKPLILDFAPMKLGDLLKSLDSSLYGISATKAKLKRIKYGLNKIASEKPSPWYFQLLSAFNTPFNYILLALAIAAIVSSDFKAAFVISFMVVTSGFLRFWQEFRSGRAAEKLRNLVHTMVLVSRPESDSLDVSTPFTDLKANESNNQLLQKDIPIHELVPGDVVHLSAGDLIPGDMILFWAKDLFINQAALSGESIPVEKLNLSQEEVIKRIINSNNVLDLPNLCFMGSSVVSGTAGGIVVCTGDQTYLGHLARDTVGQRAETSFDRGVRGVSWLLIRFIFIMVPMVFFLNGITKDNWGEAFLFGVAVAVGLTPEMLPMILTANLARGALAMSQRQVIVKKLQSIQNIGAMDILCADKTGTLTQDKVVLIQHIDINKNESEEVFEYAFLNSHFQTGLRNLLDRAVLDLKSGSQIVGLTQNFIKCDEVPFDFERRRMSVVVHEALKNRDILICKGAAEELLSVCNNAQVNGKIIPLDDSVRKLVLKLRTDLNEDGLRVIAVAIKHLPVQPNKQYGIVDECDLVLMGFIVFLDPPKESAAPAIAALATNGVAVKILTGDNDLVARKICHDVGILVDQILLGTQIEVMSDAELEIISEKINLFAKLSPTQKARIIAALKRKGHTVGFLGDGINDAPALREADAGISVDTGADIAKESADIILLEKSLLVLNEGVLLGRQTFGNTMKYIKMAASSNFGNVFSVLIASVWLPFLPMLPIHLLIQNLLYDISQTGIPFDQMDPEYLEKPHKWEVNDLGRFILFIGPISSLFDITTFGVMYFVFEANSLEKQSLFQSGWFIEGLLSQTLVIHMIRTSKIPFFESLASTTLILVTLSVMVFGLLIPLGAFGKAIGMAPLPWEYYKWLALTLLSYCLLIQFVKKLYLKKFGTWL